VKRVADVIVSAIALILLSPLLALVAVVIWSRDGHSPFYVATRVGLGGRPFRMVKFRSMVSHADRSGVDSTARDDTRITPTGRVLRALKLDELPQLWNVLCGDMSLVGPRPNVERETQSYTAAEIDLLRIRPGITDLASIVFSDEADILAGNSDPDLAYNQLIRPWKSRFGLLYAWSPHSALLDFQLLFLTAVNSLDRDRALRHVARIVGGLGGDTELQQVARRHCALRAAPPPGANAIVKSRETPRVAY
jgi:lipopolysaccharide/colanic/teichoic acid biosynthesis glycosyltransferase